MELSVIIVNYNVRVFLEQCLITVSNALKGLSGEIIVVDNASADRSIDELSPLFPEVRFIRSAENIGFARANNLGLQYANGRYVLFLNPDTLVAENSLTHCVRFLDAHSGCGAVGVRMINGFGHFLPESKRANPSLRNTFCKLSGLAAAFPQSRVFNHYALGHLPVNQQHEVAILAGAFMMVRKNVLDQLQGFDPAFFMYGEDIDLSVRIKSLGYRIYYLGDVAIVHYKGQSSRNRTRHQHRIFYTAMQLFVRKHFKLGWLLIPFIYMAQWISALKKQFFPAASVLPMLNRPGSACVIGDASACSHITEILSERNQAAIVKGTIGVHETNTTQMGRLSDLTVLCQEKNIKQIIIHVPGLSVQEAVLMMSRLNGLFFRFVFSGSNSLPFNN